MFNWMLGQLRKAVGRSFLEGRSHVRGKTPSLNRLSNFLNEGYITLLVEGIGYYLKFWCLSEMWKANFIYGFFNGQGC